MFERNFRLNGADRAIVKQFLKVFFVLDFKTI